MTGSASAQKSQPANEVAVRSRLAARLIEAVQAGRAADDRAFEALFAEVLAYQRRFAGITAQTRPLPVEIFKYRPVVTFAARPRTVFFSSGTARGRQRRSRHALADATLYDFALTRGFAQAVFAATDLAAGAAATAPRWNLLLPAPASWWRDPHSSLAHMGRTLWRSLRGHVDVQVHRVDPAAPPGELKRAIGRLNATAPARVTLGFGTGFGFLHLCDRLRAAGLQVTLHPQSRVLETGGYKGKGRQLAPADLHATLAAAFGLAPERIFAEYGMTELSSQAYQVFDRPDAPRRDLPVYRPSETMRVRALNAAGQPCAPNAIGLLEVRDLMNLTSGAWLQLGDLGWVLPPTANQRAGDPIAASTFPRPCERRDFQLLGRAQRLAARGCGLAADLQLPAR